MQIWGTRTWKTAVAVILAIYLAELIGLHQPLFAGVLAILGMDVTIRRSWRTIVARFLASIIGLVIGGALLFFFGFHVWVLGLFILICYPVCVKMGMREGVVTASVVIFHLFAEKNILLTTLLNEVGLLFIGLGIAILVNVIYVPNPESHLQRIRTEFESALGAIFLKVAEHLRQPQEEPNLRNELVHEIQLLIDDGSKRADVLAENTWWTDENGWQRYFQMREQQMVFVDQILRVTLSIQTKYPQSLLLADVCEQLGEEVQREYYSGDVARRLEELVILFRKMALPETREEFETRAALYELRQEILNFLQIAERTKKRREKKSHPSLGNRKA